MQSVCVIEIHIDVKHDSINKINVHNDLFFNVHLEIFTTFVHNKTFKEHC